MAQGNDRAAQDLVDIQPTAIIEFFLLYFNTLEKPDTFIAFHGGTVLGKPIKWQGIDYLPVPVETEGFEVSANGQMPRPKIRISNKDFFVTDLLLNNFDLQYAKIIRKRTFVKYLDSSNFDGGNPWGSADSTAEISSDTYVIGQKTSENKVFVEFELTSPLDLDNSYINNRLVLPRYCCWKYRGQGCGYTGPPIETEEQQSLGMTKDYLNDFANTKQWTIGLTVQSGSGVYLENQKVIVNKTQFARTYYIAQSNHTSTFANSPESNTAIWKKDGCSKTLKGCGLRFQNTSVQLIPTGSSGFGPITVFDQSQAISSSGLLLDYNASTQPAYSVTGGAGHVFHASIWFKPDSNYDPTLKYPLINEIYSLGDKPDISYSGATRGINVYLYDNNIIWNIATGTANSPSTNYPYTTLLLPFNPNQWTPLHICVSGAAASDDMGDTAGLQSAKMYIDPDNVKELLVGATSYPMVNMTLRSKNRSSTGRYFVFGGLHKFTSPAAGSDGANFFPLQTSSNVQIGSVAILTGTNVAPELFVPAFNSGLNFEIPRPMRWSQIPAAVQNYVGFWSDCSGLSAGDGVDVTTQRIIPSATFKSRSINTAPTGSFSTTETLYYEKAQTAQESLPFGGFPATDTFGAL